MPLKGVTALARKGFYEVEPAKLSDIGWLRNAMKSAAGEGDLATGEYARRHADMQFGALNELAVAKGLSRMANMGRSTRGLLYLDPGGHIRGAAAFDLDKGKDLLSGLQRMGREVDPLLAPSYLEYVGVTSPEVSGRDLIGLGQELYGPQMMFRAASPDINVDKYKAMGARLMPEFEEQDGMPMMLLDSPVQRHGPLRDLRQLLLPLE